MSKRRKSHKTKYSHLTRELLALELAAGNRTIDAIAFDLGVSRGTLTYLLRLHGIKAPQHKPAPELIKRVSEHGQAKLSPREAQMLELIGQGISIHKAMKQIRIGSTAKTAIMHRLRELGAIEPINQQRYRVLIDNYEIVTDEPVRRLPQAPSETRPSRRHTYATVTPEQAAYLRQHYGTVPRTQLARALGIDKVTVNNMILQLRLGS